MTRGDGKGKFVSKLNLDKRTKKLIRDYLKLKTKVARTS